MSCWSGRLSTVRGLISKGAASELENSQRHCKVLQKIWVQVVSPKFYTWFQSCPHRDIYLIMSRFIKQKKNNTPLLLLFMQSIEVWLLALVTILLSYLQSNLVLRQPPDNRRFKGRLLWCKGLVHFLKALTDGHNFFSKHANGWAGKTIFVLYNFPLSGKGLGQWSPNHVYKSYNSSILEIYMFTKDKFVLMKREKNLSAKMKMVVGGTNTSKDQVQTFWECLWTRLQPASVNS